ncbi:DNA/RNA non-specific endonuclease [Undibacterium curvum]|uniref:Endonuclease n=1 Tax=Undibacterium curvum TaxID=2762294 RepID=A0ABR7A855_9BURK|nr:DNA/RNA non-specific endonuclease [Undibacterium curvum]MBC3933078.1 DNA/RNA non-specific endonuclease [Undibacterium curvum]
MFKKFALRLVLAAATSMASVVSVASATTPFSDCPQFFAKETAPVIPNAHQLNTRPLCFSKFAVMHSGKSRTPLYVAEKLNRRSVLDAQDKERTNRFFADARLPRAERAELEDYKGSGFDRGHMAPAGDMASDEGMAQSFSLANMVPQAPENNRKTWANIEKAARKYAMRATGDVYIVTGPVFDTQPQTIGRNQVWVPKYLYKLMYDPSEKRAWAYWVENADDAKAGKPISYEELVKRTGIQFLPGIL